jgi:hypothetical protein
VSRSDRSRRKARKDRKAHAHEAQARAAEERRLHPPPAEPVDHSRLRQVFTNLSFRSHEKGQTKPFKDHVHGPTVKASTPDELAEKTYEAFVDATLGKPVN